MPIMQMPYDWRDVRSLFCPTFDDMLDYGWHFGRRKNDVEVYVSPRDGEQVASLRRWIDDACRDYEMWGQFMVCPARRSVRYRGLLFRFAACGDAVLFKLRWN